jgi:pimeloyl-ACP methyl ester carboxylesterase
METSLGFTSYGEGPIRVLVLHDWFCDHSSWDATLPYLTASRFTYVFADSRGYGLSREIEGTYTLDEASSDAIGVADRLGWSRFSLVGHSMSGLIVQRMAQLAPERIERVVAVTPVAPSGMGLDQRVVESISSMALADDETRYTAVSQMWGTRLSETWTRYKLRRWRETAAPAAAAKYVELWGRGSISDADQLLLPVLIVTCEEDAPPFRAEALEASMKPRYPSARLVSFKESGHYPMQETPPLLATTIESFLGERSAR